MKILLTGRNGQLGWELERSLAPLGAVTACDRGALDLARPEQVSAVLNRAAPEVIVNAAAYTDVDAAEADAETAFAVNARGPALLADWAKRNGALLVHYSTDYVFDGAKAGPYAEDDPAAPLNEYGRSKLEGERAVRASGAAHLVLRTSWVYGLRGRNFLTTVQRLARERKEIGMVADQVGAPTWCRPLAEASARVLRWLRERGTTDVRGLYHLSAAGQTSRLGFAERIVAISGGGARFVAIASSEYPRPAARPRNSVLSNDKFRRDWGFALPAWDADLESCLRGVLVSGADR